MKKTLFKKEIVCDVVYMGYFPSPVIKATSCLGSNQLLDFSESPLYFLIMGNNQVYIGGPETWSSFSFMVNRANLLGLSAFMLLFYHFAASLL